MSRFNRAEFENAAISYFGDEVVNMKTVVDTFTSNGESAPRQNHVAKYRVGHNRFQFARPVVVETTTVSTETIKPSRVGVISATEDDESFVPKKDPLFVSFGVYSDLNRIIKSQIFCPTYITGETGIGKTFIALQASAKNTREIIRLNMTPETDEDDLFGSFRLVNGDMIFHKGPVITAMERGALLLIDEISVAHPSRILALMSVLEGKGVFIKKLGTHIDHKPGFNVIATDNTKGQGSDSGRFIGTNVMNEAFLDRFDVTLEHTYPTRTQENKILNIFADSLHNNSDTDFVNNLCDWAFIIRKTYKDGACAEVISTRRLTNIYKLFTIFGNKKKAIEMSIARFDDVVKDSFLRLFEKIDENLIEMSQYDDKTETPEEV